MYSNLSYGSSGEEVRKMQNALINAGYDVGSSGADGVFGANTLAAVKRYQTDNGLEVDGIAGNNTLGKLYGTANTAPSATAATPAAEPVKAQSYQKANPNDYMYDPSTNAAYQSAMAALNQAQANKPVYNDKWDSQLQSIYDSIVNREPFQYDLNTDMLYNQYKDQYINLGRNAMMDTMGQAAALTGGYGSSYAQSVGQQQYDAYLQKLNEEIPELYSLALNKYKMEGDQLVQNFDLTNQLSERDYGRYRDDVSDYWTNVNYLTDRADTYYDQGYNNWYAGQNLAFNADQMSYNQMTNNYDNLTSLISSTGYNPSDDELLAAGMSRAQADALRNYFDMAMAGGGSSGGGSGGGGDRYIYNPTEEPTDDGGGGGGMTGYYKAYDQVGWLVNDGATKNEVQQKALQLKNDYGLTLEQYQALLTTYLPMVEERDAARKQITSSVVQNRNGPLNFATTGKL